MAALPRTIPTIRFASFANAFHHCPVSPRRHGAMIECISSSNAFVIASRLSTQQRKGQTPCIVHLLRAFPTQSTWQLTPWPTRRAGMFAHMAVVSRSLSTIAKTTRHLALRAPTHSPWSPTMKPCAKATRQRHSIPYGQPCGATSIWTNMHTRIGWHPSNTSELCLPRTQSENNQHKRATQ